MVLGFVLSLAGGPLLAGPQDEPAELPAHHHSMRVAGTVRSLASYPIPDLALIRDDGLPVSLREEIDDGNPIVLDFIYTTCTTVCPLSSQTFAQLQGLLGPTGGMVHLVSISIDPEQDTPQRLAEYARKYGAGPQWRHYTGSMGASVQAQRAFDVYRGDKMGHTPVTLVRTASGKPWVRFDGFATADELLGELGRHPVAR
jgi:protein SCO1/2